MTVIGFVTLFSCKPKSNNKIVYSEKELLYYDFINHDISQRSRKVKQYLEKELTTADFVLINNSTSDTCGLIIPN